MSRRRRAAWSLCWSFGGMHSAVSGDRRSSKMSKRSFTVVLVEETTGHDMSIVFGGAGEYGTTSESWIREIWIEEFSYVSSAQEQLA
jgi:hypothetical protein